MLSEQHKTGQVRRYHCNPQMVRYGQTNADHQWGWFSCYSTFIQIPAST